MLPQEAGSSPLGVLRPRHSHISEPARNTPAPALHVRSSTDADWSTGYISQITVKGFISILVLPREDVFPYLKPTCCQDFTS